MLPAEANDARRDARAEVAIEGDRELGLRAIALHDPGERLEPGERVVEHGVLESTGARVGDQIAEPLIEWTRWLLNDVLRGREQGGGKDKSEDAHRDVKILSLRVAKCLSIPAFARRRYGAARQATVPAM
jgi:hypothetical protein